MATRIRHIDLAPGTTGNLVALSANTPEALTVPSLGGVTTCFLRINNPAGSGAVVYLIPQGSDAEASGTACAAGQTIQDGPFGVDDLPDLTADANVTVGISILAIVSER